MLKGLYFESKCLGFSSGGNSTIDLPRHKKTAAKLADHERIDQAVERFFQVKQDYGKPFVCLVFDYKGANAVFKDIPVITETNDPDSKKAAKAQYRMADLRNTIRWVVNAILQWESLGWPMTPIAKVCASCPIQDCPNRNENAEV